MAATRQPLTVADIAEVMAMQAAAHEPAAIYQAVDKLAQRAIGHNLFTMMRVYETAMEVERVYSDNPKAYPVGGRKQKQGTPCGRIVLDEGKVFIARNPEELKTAFADHALILSLGIGSIMNVPISHDGRCLGTMNISNEANWFTEADAKTGLVLAGLVVPLIRPMGA
ncbi:MAG: GAF domain-containing protein [Proteobacteria bacterium]|nr:GAF domain-containing protein [Pseudomonadota bacterium]MBI3499296.1 GAF domain-containing protein [Pseudomonadota bacterium]